MIMAHLKRYMMPAFWPASVKEEKFIVRPSCGPHPISRCLPLQIVVKNVLGLVESTTEARQIIRAGKIKVDGKVRKNPKFPVGLMDIIEIPDISKHYRVDVNRKGIIVNPIKASEAAHKLCMITSKTTLKGGRTQLNLHDGRNIVLTKQGEKYSVRDSLLITVPGNSISKHFKLQKGSPGTIFLGKNIGISGKIKEVKTRESMTEKSTIIITSEKKDIETLKDYVLAGEPGGSGK